MKDQFSRVLKNIIYIRVFPTNWKARKSMAFIVVFKEKKESSSGAHLFRTISKITSNSRLFGDLGWR